MVISSGRQVATGEISGQKCNFGVKPVKTAPRGFQVVLKGGSPWGFRLAGGGDGAPLVVSHVEPGGKAWCEGNLRVGDQVLRVNDVFCYSVPTAQQLIDGAFRTLTLAAWRASGSSSQEREEPAAFSRSPMASEGIYENVGGSSSSGARSRGNGLEKDRDRRSLRKLTKDSGYETSPYSESDYANVESCWSDQASSDRSAVASPQPRTSWDQQQTRHLRLSGHFSPPAESSCSETWRRRSSCLGWAGALGRNSSTDSLNSGHHHHHHHQSGGSRRRQTSSSSSSSSSTCLPPPPPPPYCYHQQQELSMAGSRSTPVLNRAEDRQRYYNHHQQQQQQRHAETVMVSRKFPKATVYETLATKSGGLQFAPVIHGRNPPPQQQHQHQPWEGLPQSMDYGLPATNAGLHQRSASACQLYHSRQTSSQSSASEGTASSSSYAGGGHSRQLSSLSSYSEEDEEFVSARRHRQRSLSPPPPPPPARDSSSSLKSSTTMEGNGYHQQYYYFFCATGACNRPVVSTGQERSAQVHRLRRPHQFHPQQQQALLQPQYAVVLTSSSSSSSSSSISSSHGCDGSTPLLDRLRSENQQNKPWSDAGSDSGVGGGTGSTGRASVSSTASSQETLKWHGSCSDVSAAAENVAHSARVQPPERHNSESVLYYGGELDQRPSESNNEDSPPPLPAKTRRWADHVEKKNRLNRNGAAVTTPQPSSPEEHRAVTVAERVLNLERGGRPSSSSPHHQHQNQQARRMSETKPRASLKAIQKMAVLSFFERQTGITTSRSSMRDKTFQPRQSTRSLPRDYYQECKRQQQLMEAEAASTAALAAAEAAATDAINDSMAYEASCGPMSSPDSVSSKSSSSSSSHAATVTVDPADHRVPWVLAQPRVGDPPDRSPATIQPEEVQRRASFRRPALNKQTSRCSTPELPLPPPPRNTDTEVLASDEPLPPPPTPEEVDAVADSKPQPPPWERVNRPRVYGGPNPAGSPVSPGPPRGTVCEEEDQVRRGSDSAIEDTTSSSDSPAPDDKRGSSDFSSPVIEVDSSRSSSPTPTPSPVPPRPEDVEVERLSRDLVGRLPPTDQILRDILVAAPEMKTMADYMEGIFADPGHRIQSRPRRPFNGVNNINNNNVDKLFGREGESLPGDSAYFTTSESKARFLVNYAKDMNARRHLVDSSNLLRGKEELMGNIARKLDNLRVALLAVHEEMDGNEELGRHLTAKVETLARANEADKYKLHVEEVEKVTSLLLGLSGRLARAENALKDLGQDHNPDGKRILEAKRNKLHEQHEEAKKLKEDIDRRSVRVSAFLDRYLSAEEHEDYHHFIKMKSKLLVDAREIDNKIKLGEEQMSALHQSLSPPSKGP